MGPARAPTGPWATCNTNRTFRLWSGAATFCPRSVNAGGVDHPDLTPDEQELADKLEVILLPYDPVKADEALEALAEALVAAWVAKQQAAGRGTALPPTPGS